MHRIGQLLLRARRLWDEGIIDADTHFGGYRQWRAELAEAGFRNLRGVRVLDIGCGDRAPLSLLLAADGASVDAIDLMPVRVGWQRPRMWLELARGSGLREAARQLTRDLVHTWRYWRHLRRRMGRPLPLSKVRFHQMDAQHLRFPDDAFTVVISSAVWEHIPDVEGATREVNRVLSPAGVAIVQVALFPALQGGHHAEWHSAGQREQPTIRPWDHLLPDARPLPLYCNGWRESQYRSVFERTMDVVRWEGAELTGSKYLTDERRLALADYTERDLLMPHITIWARKRIAVAPADAPREAACANGPSQVVPV